MSSEIYNNMKPEVQASISAWVRSIGGDNVEIYESEGNDHLGKLLKDHAGEAIAVILPSRTESKWWAKYVGATNRNLLTLQGRPSGSSVGLAVVVYPASLKNVIDDQPKPADFLIPDATVIIPRLMNLGYTGKAIAEALNVNEMTISRANSKRSGHYDERSLLNQALNRLLIKTMNEQS